MNTSTSETTETRTDVAVIVHLEHRLSEPLTVLLGKDRILIRRVNFVVYPVLEEGEDFFGNIHGTGVKVKVNGEPGERDTRVYLEWDEIPAAERVLIRERYNETMKRVTPEWMVAGR